MSKPPTAPVLFSRTLAQLSRRVFVLSCLLLLVTTGILYTRGGTPEHAYAATTSNLNFQARLLGTAGAIVPDGSYNVQFKLYSVSTGGAALWTETYYDSNGGTPGNDNRVTVRSGYLSVHLGSQTAFPGTINWDEELWLTMNIGGTTQTATPTWDGEMDPRLKLTAVPYAFKAGQAAAVKTADTNAASTNSAAVSITSGNAAGSTSNSGNVTIDAGTATQTTGQLLFGTTNASALTIGRAGITTTIQGTGTFTGAGTALSVTNNATIGGTLGVTGVSTLSGGLTVGVGTNFINQGSSLFSAVAISDVAGGGNIGTAAATVDAYTTFNVNQTTAGQTLTLPSPTTTTSGRMVFVNNVGSASFTMYGSVIAAGKSNAFIWNGSAWVTTVSLSGSVVNTIGTLDSVSKSADGASISSNAIYLQTADATYPGLVSTGTQTFAGAKTFTGDLSVQNVTLAAGKSLAVTGGNTASRPGSPTEGMVYYDTTTKQLLVYANGKWQADRSTATKIVAASNSSQAIKDSADYVADGTGDQVEINAALTAAAGGKVYLAEGTYTINASISVPNNTTLVGAGAGTLITIPNSFNTDISAITNTTTGGNGTGITIQDLKVDGNISNQSTGAMNGIDFNGVGSGSGSSAIAGGKIVNVTSGKWLNGYPVRIYSSANSSVNNNTIYGTNSTGIVVDLSTHVTVNNNIVHSGGWSNIFVTNSNDVAVTGNAAQGAQRGVAINASSLIAVTGNTITSTSLNAIYIVGGSSKSEISANVIRDSGSTTDNNGIYISNSDDNTIVGNSIIDTSATTTNYAISILDSTADRNYLADNRFSSTAGTSTINDAGTGTVYANQARAENGGQLTVRTADSTAAFQVQNAAGTGLLTVDTTNGQTVLRGVQDTPTLGSELVTSQDFSNATYWTCSTGWTTTTTTAQHNTGNTNTCAATNSNFTVTAGTRYEITWTMSGVTSGSVTPSIGGVNGSSRSANSSVTAGITASTTGQLTFTPSSTFNGTISAVSIKTSTGTSAPQLVIKDQAGTSVAELRVTSTNTALGLNSLRYNTTGTSNTAMGMYSLQNNTTGYSNTATGNSSLQNNTTGYYNTAHGNASLYSSTTGYYNTASGSSSLYYNTTGSENTAAGFSSLYNNTSGSSNTAFGINSLKNNTTGSMNTALGYRAGLNDYYQQQFTTLSNLQGSTLLGYDAQAYANNVLALGGQGQSAISVGINTGLPANRLSAESYRYSTGSVTTDGTANIVGTGTTFTSDMVGNIIYIATNSASTAPYRRTITAFTDATHITVDSTVPALTNAEYYINYIGLQMSTTGNVGINTLSPANKLNVNTLTTADSLAQVAISTGATTNKGLVVQGVAGQTANLVQFQSSSGGTVLSYISSSGAFKFGNGAALAGAFAADLNAFNGDAVGMAVKAYSAQTSDLIQLQNSSGAVISGFNATGNLFVGTTSAANKVNVNALTTADSLAQVAISTGATTNKGLVVQGVAGQTASIFEVQNSTGADVFKVTNNSTYIGSGADAGRVSVNQNNFFTAPSAAVIKNDSANTTTALTVSTSSSTQSALLIRAASGQSVDILQVQASNTGEKLSGINANGGLYTYGTNNTFAGLATPAFTTASTGSSYYYVITATNASGETMPSSGLGMANNTSLLQWSQVNGATGYKLYRNSTNNFSSGSLLLATITNGTTVSYTDTGGATAAGLPPTSVTGTKLYVQGWRGQNSNLLLQVQDGNSSDIFSVTGYGTTGIRIQDTNSVGLYVRGKSGQTGDLLQLQDSNGLINGAFNAAGNQLTLGRIAASGTVTQGKLLFSDGTTDNYGLTLQSATLTNNQTITFPNETGTVCTTGSVCTGYAPSATNGYVQFAPAAAQTDTTTNSSIFINKTGASGNILELQKAGTDVFSINNTGVVTIQNSADSTAALSVKNLAGTSLLTVDTTNGQTVLRSVKTFSSLGSEELTRGGDFNNATYWSCSTGWTPGAFLATHNSGNTNTCSTTASNLSVTAGTTYRVRFWLSGDGSNSLTVSLGGVTSSALVSNGQKEIIFTATNTNGLVFTPASSFTGSVDSISVKSVNASSSVLNLKDDTGLVVSETRADSNDAMYYGLQSGTYAQSGTYSNSAFGAYSLQKVTSGGYNSAFGAYSLQNNTTGYSNTAIGQSALNKNTSGAYNTAVGDEALMYNVEGDDNIAIGSGALRSLTNGSRNVGIGRSAAIGVTGSDNTALGYDSLAVASTGSGNTAIGSYSMQSNVAGQGSTALGYYAGYIDQVQTQFKSLNNLQGSTMLGAYSQAYANNVLALGGQGADAISVGINTGLPANRLSAESYRYSTGSVTTNGTANIVGTGTTFTSDMVGNVIYIATNSASTAPYRRTITAFTDATHITVDSTVPALTNAEYYINYIGLQMSTTGNVGINTLSPANKLNVNTLTTADSLAQVAISTGATTNKGLVVQGIASQTANLIEAQNNTATPIFTVGSTGNLMAAGIITAAGNTFRNGDSGAVDTSTLTVRSGNTVAGGLNTGGLVLQSGDATVSGNTGAVTLRSGNATSGNSGNVALDAGTATGTTGSITLGATNASAITLGRSGITTTNAGALTVAQLLTGQLGATISGAAISLNDSSNFNTSINGGTSTGAVTIGNSAAGAISLQSASTIGLTGTTTITGRSTGDALTINNSTSTGNIFVAQDNGSPVFTIADGGNVGINNASPTNKFSINAYGTGTYTDTQAYINTGAAANRGLVIQVAASPTADPFQIVNSSGSVLSGFTGGGRAYYASGAPIGSAILTVATGSTTGIGVYVQGTNGQTADLMRLADNNAVAIAAFTATGVLNLGNTTTINASSTARAGSIVFGDGTATTLVAPKTGTLQLAGALASNQTYLLPTTGGTLLTQTAADLAYIQNQNAGQQATSNFWISGTGRADTSFTTPLLDTATAVALNVGTTNATAINLNKNVVVAASQSLTVTGGNTASRPGSPTAGMLYYDTTTNQMIQYNGTKWVSDRTTATKIVAASNSSQAVKDAADYVADGTGDQVEINAALTAAAGGKVYLAEGTYSASATITIPNNTTLAGAGRGTLIQLADIDASDNLIEKTAGQTTGMVIQDLRLDGQKALQTGAITQHGIYMNAVGSGDDASAVPGIAITNVWVDNFETDGIYITGSSNNRIVNTTLTGNGRHGIQLETTYNSTVNSNKAQGNGEHGVTITTGARNTVTGNVLQNNLRGVYLEDADNNTITGNIARESTQAGILLYLADGNTVTGNSSQTNTLEGIVLDTSHNNVISSNKIANNSGATNNDGIKLSASDANTITGNDITDSSATIDNNAIDVSDNTSDNNYLADNRFSSTPGTSTINDAGTGTIFANQPRAENGGQLTIKAPNSTTTFQVQNAAGTNILAVDTSNSRVLVGSAIDTTTATTLSLGTTTATAITIGRTGITTTNAGALTVAQLLTGQLGATISGAAISLNDSSNFNTSINGGTSTGTVTIGNSAAGAIAIQSGSTLSLSSTGALSVDSSAAISIGTTTATGVTIGRAGQVTTLQGSSVALNTDTITSNQATVALLNSGVTTVNAFGAATTINIGADTGTTTINNSVVLGSATSDLITVNGIIQGGNPFVFEGSGADANELTLQVTNPTADRTIILPNEDGTVCTTGSVCTGYAPASGSANYIQNQNAGQQATSNFWISGTGRADTSFTTPLLDTATAVALNVGTTNATAINLNQNTVLATGKTLRVTGDVTANRPAATTAGQLYYDTTTNQMLISNGTKWVSDRSTATKIVAATDSSQAMKDAADYVTDGTDDQVEINAALTAAAGGKVYLAEGTYTVHQTASGDATIKIPNNTTLAGAGYGTLVQLGDFDATDNLIQNTDTANGEGVVIRDMHIDGQDNLNTAGTQKGIYLNNVGDTTSSKQGALIDNVWADDFRTYGIQLYDSDNGKISNVSAEDSDVGIYIGATSQSNTIVGNYAEGNSTAGIGLDTATWNTVTGNTVRGNGTGIYLLTSTNNTVTGNTVYANNTYGIRLDTSSDRNTIASNNLYSNGAATTNNGIFFTSSDYNTVSGNDITDTSCSTNCYAIRMDAGSDYNYLTGNRFSDSDAGATAIISDAGTGNVYANQSVGIDGTQFVNRTANDPAAFQVQNAAGNGILTVDTSNSEVEVGNASVAGKLVISDGSSNTATITVNALAGNYSVAIPTITGNDTFCLQSANNCGGINSNLTDNIADALDIQEGTNNYININTTNSSENISFGNATTNPSYNFLGSGRLTVASGMDISGTYTTANSSKLSITGSLASSVTSSQYGFSNQVSFNPSGASLTNIYALNNSATLSGSALNVTTFAGSVTGISTGAGYTGQVTTGYGLLVSAPSISGSQPIATYKGIMINTNANGDTTTGTVYNHQLHIQGITAAAGGGGSVTNYGINLVQPSGNTAGTYNYGLYLSGNGGASATANYAIYSTSTAASLLSGNLDVQSGSTGNLLRVRDTTATAVDVLTIADGGAATFRNQTDSTSGFAIQDKDGNSRLVVDTTSDRVDVSGAYLRVTGTTTSSVAVQLNQSNFTIQSSAATSQYAVQNQAKFDLLNTGASLSALYGMMNVPTITTTAGTSTTIAAVYGEYLRIDKTSSSVAITGQYGLRVDDGNDVNVTNKYGIYVDEATSATASILFSLYVDGSTGSYFGVKGDGLVDSRSDSTTGFQILNSGTSSVVLNVDTANTRLGIGTSAPSTSLAFGAGADRTIGVEARSSNAAGRALTISAGAAGAGASAFTGGLLTLQGGAAAGTGNANGGNVLLTGGAGTGTGVKGLVVIDTPTFTTASTQSCGVDCTITQANVDANAAVIINATAASLTVTMPDPTITTAGRVVYVTAANASNDFSLSVNGGGTGNVISMRQNTTATMIWNGSDWTAAGASSSTTLQAAYDNTLSSAGGAEIVLNNTATSNGLTVRNNASSPIIGGIFEVQTSIGSNLLSVNNNATEYATNGGAETAGASASTFPANTWDNTTGGTVDRWTTAGDNIATGAASVRVQTTTTNHGARNRISTSLTSGLTYAVSFAVRGATNFSTLQVLYSPDGTTTGTTQCATAQTATSGIWTRISCTFVASGSITSSNSILIRQTDATARTFYLDNLSINISASATYAADGSVDDSGAFATNWTAYGTGSTATRDTGVLYDTSASARGDTTNNADRGIRNNLAITPAVSTQYLVSFYAKAGTGAINDLTVRYSRDGGTNFAACVDYNTQAITTSTWTKITCLFTTDSTTPTNADLIFTQATAPGGTRSIYIDALSVTLNTNNANNVQIGGANEGGPATLFTLDRASSAPIADNNNAYLGSMYYDTTTGRIQCYEADGWGACGSAPDNIVNLNPEYAGAVLNGTGIGTMTTDLCANQTSVLTVNTSLCASGEAKNFYKWTSPQATQQTYSIYVSYQLPTTFKGFASDDTVQLTARVDSTTNAAVTYEMYRSESGTITQCGSGETAVTSSINTWQTVGINGNESTGCSFTSSSGGAYVIFKINVKANSNANAYVSTLSFTTTGK